MVIGILTVKNNRYHPNGRLLEAARGLGHRAILVNPRNFLMGMDRHRLKFGPLKGRFRADVILPRIGSTIKEYSLVMVRHFELMGVPVINNFDSILLARNKFLTLQTLTENRIPVPESRYASNWSNFHEAVSQLGGFPVVIKTSNSRQGKGVALIHSVERSGALLEGLLNTGQGLLIQEFIPPEERRDVRVMVIGEKVFEAMSLTPVKGEFRANIHLNAKAETIKITGDMAAVAVKSAKALGLDIAGVDMLEEKDGVLHVIDVNSTPGFRGLEKCTGKDVASEIIRYVTASKREAR